MSYYFSLCGDSTSFWIRPVCRCVNKKHCCYTRRLLEKDNYRIENFSRPGLTSFDALEMTWNKIVPKNFDINFYSFGINDASLRSYPNWMARKFGGVIATNLSILDRLFLLIYRFLANNWTQKQMSRFGFSKPWVTLDQFKYNVEKIINILSKENNCLIIFTTIPNVSERVEKILKGLNKVIINYNKVLLKLSNKYDNVVIIDLNKTFLSDPNIYIPEGIHFSCKGHNLVYNKINEVIDEWAVENN